MEKLIKPKAPKKPSKSDSPPTSENMDTYVIADIGNSAEISRNKLILLPLLDEVNDDLLPNGEVFNGTQTMDDPISMEEFNSYFSYLTQLYDETLVNINVGPAYYYHDDGGSPLWCFEVRYKKSPAQYQEDLDKFNARFANYEIAYNKYLEELKEYKNKQTERSIERLKNLIKTKENEI